MTTETLNVATEIYNQIGRRAFVMMGTPKGSYLGSANSLQFDIKGCKSCNRIIITLDPSDTYTIGFHKIGRAPSFKVTSKFVSDVYADSLRTVIESETGLYLSL